MKRIINILSEAKNAKRGDTIIEVMIAITIFALALVVSLTSTNRSLHSGTDATNRQQALSIAQQQVEFIKNALGTDLQTLQTYTAAPASFCINPASGQVLNASAPAKPCNQFGGSQYNLSITHTTVANKATVFKVTTTWPSTASTINDSLFVYYKVPQAGTKPPIVSSCSANVTANTQPGAATLSGIIDPNGLDTNWHFSYGTSASFGTNAPVPDGLILGGAGPTSVSANITGLSAGSYFFTLVATNSDGSGSCSSVGRFTINSPPPPSPTVTLTAKPNSVSSGGTSTLSWVTANATSCSAKSSPNTPDWNPGTKPNASGGSTTVTPKSTTTYTIDCTGPGGSANGSATVTVTAGGGQPPTVTMTSVSLGPGGIGGNKILYLGGTVDDHGVSGTTAWFHYIECGSGNAYAPHFFTHPGQPQAVPTNNGPNTITYAANPFSFYYCGYHSPSNFQICAQNSASGGIAVCSNTIYITESGGSGGGGGGGGGGGSWSCSSVAWGGYIDSGAEWYSDLFGNCNTPIVKYWGRMDFYCRNNTSGTPDASIGWTQGSSPGDRFYYPKAYYKIVLTGHLEGDNSSGGLLINSSDVQQTYTPGGSAC